MSGQSFVLLSCLIALHRRQYQSWLPSLLQMFEQECVLRLASYCSPGQCQRVCRVIPDVSLDTATGVAACSHRRCAMIANGRLGWVIHHHHGCFKVNEPCPRVAGIPRTCSYYVPLCTAFYDSTTAKHFTECSLNMSQTSRPPRWCQAYLCADL